MNLSIIPNEIIAKEIYPNFEHKDLTNLRLVSKQFLKNSDNESLYEIPDFKMKKSWESVLDIRNKILHREKGLRSIDRKIQSEEGKLELLNQTWFGYFVSFLDTKNCILLTIKSILCRIFPSVKTELSNQINIKDKISNFKAHKIFLTNILTSLQQKKTSLEENFIKTDHEYDKIRSYDLIKNLFGGRRSFEKLPILDIGNREGHTGYIDFIKTKELTAPFMRGVDKFGREFVVIKAKNKFNSSESCQIFFKRSAKGSNWTDAGQSIISVSGYFIEGRHKKEEVYNNFKKLIDEKQFNQFEIL